MPLPLSPRAVAPGGDIPRRRIDGHEHGLAHPSYRPHRSGWSHLARLAGTSAFFREIAVMLNPDVEREPTEVLFPRRHAANDGGLIVLRTLLAVVGLTAGLTAGFGGSPPENNKATTGSEKNGPSAASVTGHVARVATVDLTQNDKFSEIAAVGHRILLYGSTSQSTYPEVAGTCFSAWVDPSSLVLSDERSGSCANPTLQGQQVVPVFGIDKDLPARGGGPSAVVRIAHAVARSPGYTLGPVVLTFPALAWGDSAPSWIYGGGDLWLYEWDNPGGFDLVRVSATTGDVLQRMEVPKIWHPVLAYNDEGLWIAPSGQTGSPEALYLVAPGGTHASAVFHFPADGFAKWILGSGDALWVNAQPRPVSEFGVVWMLRGPKATPVWHVRESSEIVQVSETLGGSGMVGNELDGLWAAAPTAFDQQRVVRIEPASGVLSPEVTLTAGYSGSAKHLYLSPLTAWKGVTLAGSFFLLDPPAPVPGTASEFGGFSALYRITPSGGAMTADVLFIR